jgi:hypothetical protein
MKCHFQVISNKCKVLQIKRENFDRLLRENKDVLEFLKQKWLTKKQFFRDRIDTFLDVRSRFLVKKKKE